MANDPKRQVRDDAIYLMRQDGLSYAELGRMWGLSQERVRGICNKERWRRSHPSRNYIKVMCNPRVIHWLNHEGGFEALAGQDLIISLPQEDDDNA